MKSHRIFAMFFLLSSFAFGQQPMTTYSGSITTQIINMVTAGQPVFLAFGSTLLTWLAVIMLVIYGLKWALASASNYHGHFDFPAMVHFFCLFVMAEMMLRFYNATLPWSSSSFSNLLPNTGMALANAITTSSFQTLITQVGALLKIMQTQSPSIFHGGELVMYTFVTLDMLLIEGLLFAITITGFVAIGIGAVLGPVFIPWLAVPRLSFLFWNWISFMLQYSFYQVVAAALVYVWTNVLVTFLSGWFNGNYSLGHFAAIVPGLTLLNIGMFWSMLKIHSFVSDLFKGAASMGSAFSGGQLLGMIRGIAS
ncbi:MAG: type IV secretion system protein [Bryobacteraceae bacterium]